MAIRTDDVSMALAALDRNSIIIFFCTLVTAFIGFISGAISIFLIKKSEEQLELATNPTTKQ